MGFLAQLGHDVDTVPAEGLAGKDDEAVWMATHRDVVRLHRVGNADQGAHPASPLTPAQDVPAGVRHAAGRIRVVHGAARAIRASTQGFVSMPARDTASTSRDAARPFRILTTLPCEHSVSWPATGDYGVARAFSTSSMVIIISIGSTGDS